MRKVAIFFFTLLLLQVSATPSRASRPVDRNVNGCVAGGVLYDLYESRDAAGKRTITAYPLKIKGLDLSRYEGRKVSVQGKLSPGDRFSPIPETLRVHGPCDKGSQAAINKRR